MDGTIPQDQSVQRNCEPRSRTPFLHTRSAKAAMLSGGSYAHFLLFLPPFPPFLAFLLCLPAPTFAFFFPLPRPRRFL
jgi:hypothetical protein